MTTRPTRLLTLLVFLFLWVGCKPAGDAREADSPTQKPPIIALVGATVFDATGSDPLLGATVLIEGDRIKALGTEGQLAVPAHAQVIDASDRFIVPGLIDTHIHFFQSGGLYTRPDAIDLRKVRPYEDEMAIIEKSLEDTFRRYLVCGVTAVVDMGGPFWNFEVRELARKTVHAPRVAVAGPLISTVSRAILDIGDPPIIRADSPAQAKELVRAQLKHDPDLMKIWFVLAKDRDYEEMISIVKAVIEESHGAGVRVAVHATQLRTARTAVEAGADILVHSVTDEPLDAELIELIKTKRVLYIPTLIVRPGYAEVLGQQVQMSELDRRYGDPQVMATWDEFASVAGEKELEVGKSRKERAQKSNEVSTANLVRAQRAGFIVAAGTDAGNIGTLHGTSMLEEMQAMAAAGLDTKEVLISATRNAARVFAKDPEFGTIEPGKLADMLVLSADPLIDLDNLQRIELVIKGGVVLRPNEILAPNE